MPAVFVNREANMFTRTVLSLTKYREDRVYRVVVQHAGGYVTGSGFFVGGNKFLTCFHVAFTKGLKLLRTDTRFTTIVGPDEHTRLQTFFGANIVKIEIEIPNDIRLTATLSTFNENYDIAVFKVALAGNKIKECIVDWKPKLNRGDHVFFAGFPTHHDYALDQAPLAVQEGMISSFVETVVGGESYKHLQINSINLGGNSGAPLFRKWGVRVIGIVNGVMNFGNDNVMIKDPNTNQVTPQSLRIPLSIAYATTTDILKEKTTLFG